VPILYAEKKILEKNQNQNFWWYFKVPQDNSLWIDFGKIWKFWAVLVKFCYIGSG
jgi:hypothetical protein